MTHLIARLRLPLLCLLPLTVCQGAWAANDFPTVDRVLYVQECIATHPGPNYEMVNKCSCALDALAETVKYDDYVEMSTATKATTIGGERGGYIRDNTMLQDQIKRYKGLQAKVEKSCFLNPAVTR